MVLFHICRPQNRPPLTHVLFIITHHSCVQLQFTCARQHARRKQTRTTTTTKTTDIFAQIGCNMRLRGRTAAAAAASATHTAKRPVLFERTAASTEAEIAFYIPQIQS